MFEPTLALTKAKLGEPTKKRLSPDTSPDKAAVPVTDPAVVPS